MNETIDAIVNIVAEYYNVPKEIITAGGKKCNYARLKHRAIYIVHSFLSSKGALFETIYKNLNSKEQKGITLDKIGQYFNGIDRCLVAWSIKLAKKYLERYPATMRDVEAINMEVYKRVEFGSRRKLITFIENGVKLELLQDKSNNYYFFVETPSTAFRLTAKELEIICDLRQVALDEMDY